MTRSPLLATLLALAAGGGAPLAAQRAAPACAADNGGLLLPQGLCALVVAESIGPVRYIAVAPNGDLFAATSGQRGALLLLRDGDGDGRAEIVRRVHEGPASGVLVAGDAVYYAPNDRVLRFPWRWGSLEPAGPVETIVAGLPADRSHAAKTLAMGPDGRLYVNIGVPSNSCQMDQRTPRSPGVDPCAELETRGGIWSFDSRRANQGPADGRRQATGLRNAMALDFEPSTGTLYMATHGRDNLVTWGWTPQASAELPAEEFGPVRQGADYGWPYCYYDPFQRRKVLAPEYGGDGRKTDRCTDKTLPAIGFPAHWAPMDLTFYADTTLGPAYRGGAFLSFHGSWNRAPMLQAGYRVVFLPFQDGVPTGVWTDFILPAGASNAIRPVGVAVGPDGSLYVAADANQKVWRIVRRPAGS